MSFDLVKVNSIIIKDGTWYKVMKSSPTGFLIENYVTRQEYNLTKQDFDNQGFNIIYTSND